MDIENALILRVLHLSFYSKAVIYAEIFGKGRSNYREVQLSNAVVYTGFRWWGVPGSLGDSIGESKNFAFLKIRKISKNAKKINEILNVFWKFYRKFCDFLKDFIEIFAKIKGKI